MKKLIACICVYGLLCVFCMSCIQAQENVTDPILDEPVSEQSQSIDDLDLPGESSGIEKINQEIQQLKITIGVNPADILLLKNGDTVEGVIRNQTNDIVSIETINGLEVYTHDEIEFIEEISEEERFSLLHKMERLHKLLEQKVSQSLVQERQQLIRQEEKAKEEQQQLSRALGENGKDLFSLTQSRLEEIVKEFAQFPPDYWRYYHRKRDAVKTVLELNRLRRYAHPQFNDIIELYIKAFEYKQEEWDESEGSVLRRQYQDSYKNFFRQAERRRITLTDVGAQ